MNEAFVIALGSNQYVRFRDGEPERCTLQEADQFDTKTEAILQCMDYGINLYTLEAVESTERA